MEDIKQGGAPDQLPVKPQTSEGDAPVGAESSTQDDAELKAEKEKVEKLEKQLFQAGHVIEELKKGKEESPIDETVLEQKIQEGIEKALQTRLPDQAAAKAEENFKNLLRERDEALLALRSKQNRSSGSGGSQKPKLEVKVQLTPAQEQLARAYNIPPEKLLKQ